MKNPAYFKRKDGTYRTDEEAREYMESLPPTPLPIGNGNYMYEVERKIAKENRKRKNMYKERIDKALAYIKENAWYDYRDNEEVITISKEKLLEILQGDDKE